MFGYRTGETPVIQVHIKRPKPFKWLRKLFQRMKFKHARFDDGKHSRSSKDIEKWHDDALLIKADYSDHRWQVVNGRSRSRRGRNKRASKSSSSKKAKLKDINTKSSSLSCSSAKPVIKETTEDVSVFLNMDTVKHVLDSDIIGDGGNANDGQSSTPSAEVGKSNSWRKRCKEHMSRAARKAEASVWTRFTRYKTLQVELSPVKTRRIDPVRGDCCPADTSYVFPAGDVKDSATPKPSNVINSLTTENNNFDSPQAHNHENDNDYNHSRVFDTRMRFNKKPKKRKSRKSRPRRKGKYVELVESSTESLVEMQVEPQKQSCCKVERVKRSRNETHSNPLQMLAIRFQDLAGAPCFHPAKYSGYKRFLDE